MHLIERVRCKKMYLLLDLVRDADLRVGHAVESEVDLLVHCPEPPLHRLALQRLRN
jgi:hypothetical protein